MSATWNVPDTSGGHDLPRPLTTSDANSRLALVRTRLAHERTMLSWARTATSLITFGFGVHQAFHVSSGFTGTGRHVAAAYLFGTSMVGIGLVALVLAALEHRASSAELAQEYPTQAGFPAAPRSYARLLGLMIGLLGVGALIVMLLL